MFCLLFKSVFCLILILVMLFSLRVVFKLDLVKLVLSKWISSRLSCLIIFVELLLVSLYSKFLILVCKSSRLFSRTFSDTNWLGVYWFGIISFIINNSLSLLLVKLWYNFSVEFRSCLTSFNILLKFCFS